MKRRLLASVKRIVVGSRPEVQTILGGKYGTFPIVIYTGGALFMTEINNTIAYRNISVHLIGISRSRIKFAELLKT